MTEHALDPISDVLAPGEEVRGHAPLVEGTVAVTNERLFVANGPKIAVNITWARLRRVQLDIERQRPATLVVVAGVAERSAAGPVRAARLVPFRHEPDRGDRRAARSENRAPRPHETSGDRPVHQSD